MFNALYDLNIEADFVPAGDPSVSRRQVALVPPLYSASDGVLQQIISDYVKAGGNVVLSFNSGFTDEHSTVPYGSGTAASSLRLPLLVNTRS